VLQRQFLDVHYALCQGTDPVALHYQCIANLHHKHRFQKNRFLPARLFQVYSIQAWGKAGDRDCIVDHDDYRLDNIVASNLLDNTADSNLSFLSLKFLLIFC